MALTMLFTAGATGANTPGTEREAAARARNLRSYGVAEDPKVPVADKPDF